MLEKTSIEEYNVRLRVLEITKEMLHNAYVNKKAHRHNQWTTQSEIALKLQGTQLPYPTFEPYFSESEVTRVAAKLLAFVTGEENITQESADALWNSVEPVEPPLDQLVTSSDPLVVLPAIPVPPEPESVQHTEPPLQEDARTSPTIKTTVPRSENKGLRVFSGWRRPSIYTSD